MVPCTSGLECTAGLIILIVGTLLTAPIWWITLALVAAGIAALKLPPGRWRK